MTETNMPFALKMVLPQLVKFIQPFIKSGKIKITTETGTTKDKFIIETDKLSPEVMEQIKNALDGKEVKI